MAEIAVSEIKSDGGGFEFEVVVREGGSQTSHRVRLKKEYFLELTKGRAAPEELVGKSFEFLLENEPKESILGSFDLSVIARYFPGYPDAIKKTLLTAAYIVNNNSWRARGHNA